MSEANDKNPREISSQLERIAADPAFNESGVRGDLLRAAELIDAAYPRSPVGGEFMLQRWFLMPTGGTDKGLDAVHVFATVLKELDCEERAAVLAYVVARFAGEQR